MLKKAAAKKRFLIGSTEDSQDGQSVLLFDDLVLALSRLKNIASKTSVKTTFHLFGETRSEYICLTFSTSLRCFSRVLRSTRVYLTSGASSSSRSASQRPTAAVFPGAKATPARRCEIHRALPSTRSTSVFTPALTLAPLRAAFSARRREATMGTTNSGNAMLPCTARTESHSAVRKAASWAMFSA